MPAQDVSLGGRRGAPVIQAWGSHGRFSYLLENFVEDCGLISIVIVNFPSVNLSRDSLTLELVHISFKQIVV